MAQTVAVGAITPAQPPGIGAITPAQPPGTGGVTTLLGWGAWGVTVACVIGVFAVAGLMAVRHHRGEGGGEHLGKLGWVLTACILGVAAGPMVNAISV